MPPLFRSTVALGAVSQCRRQERSPFSHYRLSSSDASFDALPKLQQGLALGPSSTQEQITAPNRYSWSRSRSRSPPRSLRSTLRDMRNRLDQSSDDADPICCLR
ncbi:hypothetical protein OPV22_033717 [Ensete ventricosum]|uniref:Uncharacterized protein n=1 Tax=Ensete ventricosum TaxID=4639 RepID=A0AAV8P3K9_ENSVE|nr:hypothetical protein OPV22_033717 [Ensete ventricosum]RZR96171.1 hypothetical protein BHM03_00025155 [Ensete ventricosum]